MGICVYWSCRHVVFVKRCNYLFYLTAKAMSKARRSKSAPIWHQWNWREGWSRCFGGGSGIIWPSIFMIPALFTLMIPDSLAILFRYSWFICHCFNCTCCFNVSTHFLILLNIISLNESPKVESQERWNKWYDRPTRTPLVNCGSNAF